MFNNDETVIRDRIRIANSKSQPLILLAREVMAGKDAGFSPSTNSKVAVVGERNASDPAAIKLLPLLQERVGSRDGITPTYPERAAILGYFPAKRGNFQAGRAGAIAQSFANRLARSRCLGTDATGFTACNARFLHPLRHEKSG